MNSKNSMTLELLWILIVLLYFATLYAPSTFCFYLGNNSIVVVCIGTFFIGNQLMPSVKMQKW